MVLPAADWQTFTPLPLALGDARILVVEDDRELNRAVCAFLGRNGYEAVGCLCAEEAYDALYETVFDLIISDIMMPGTDGFEFARSTQPGRIRVRGSCHFAPP